MLAYTLYTSSRSKQKTAIHSNSSLIHRGLFTVLVASEASVWRRSGLDVGPEVQADKTLTKADAAVTPAELEGLKHEHRAAGRTRWRLQTSFL